MTCSTSCVSTHQDTAATCMSLCPSVIALLTAFLSAHTDKPYDAFSMLHPVRIQCMLRFDCLYVHERFHRHLSLQLYC